MTDDRTLEEVATDDVNQLEQAYKDSTLYRFDGNFPAYEHQKAHLMQALAMLGLPNSAFMTAEAIDGFMQEKNVRIETRNYSKEEDPDGWRKGIYVYKMKQVGSAMEIDELAYFIGNIKVKTPGAFDRIRKKEWGFRSNVPMDGMKFYSLPTSTIIGSSSGVKIGGGNGAGKVTA